MRTLGDYLEQAVGRFSTRPALLYRPRYRTEVWSYARLWEQSGRVARWLQARGIERGDRVVLWAPNSPWWVAAFFGCVRLGAIVVPLDLRSSPEYVGRVLQQTEPKMALLYRLNDGGWDYPAPMQRLEDLDAVIGASTGNPITAEVTPDDVAEVIFTSGTTGDPKGVILTHGNITANAESAMQVIPTSEDYRLISLLPLSHMFEQTVGLLLPLGCGASVYYPASRQSTMIFRDFKSQGITTVLAVPQAFALFMAAIEREVRKQGKDAAWQRLQRLAAVLPMPARRLLFRSVHRRLGGRLQFLVSGGAPLEPELIRKWELLGLPVLQGYGATEAAPIISGTSLGDRRPGTVGKAVPGVEMKLAEDGEVLVRGPNITRGYWRNSGATAEAFRDGWYCTGDLGHLSDDGFLSLRGRKKDLIVLANGQNVYPADVENALRDVGGTIEVVVVGLPTPHGAQVHAVLLGDPATLDPAVLVREANGKLAAHQQIQGCTIWPEPDFPRTHTLKVKKQDVLRVLLERSETVDRPSSTPTPIRGEMSPLLRLVAEAAGMPAAELRMDAALGEDCGLDSLGRVELLAAIEGELGVYLDESQVAAQTTLAELDTLVQSQQSSSRPDFPRWPLSTAAGVVRRSLQAPAFALLDYLAPATVVGASLDDLTPPVLFVANHASHLDSAVLLRSLPACRRRRVAVAAAADYFFTRPLLGAGVALALNAFPFSREGNIRPTLEHCAWLLDQGWSILIYPEGTRSTSGEIGPFKAGAGLLAVELGVQVVPIRLEGMEQILPKGRGMPRRGRVQVRIGQPMRFSPETSYTDASAAMEVAVRNL